MQRISYITSNINDYTRMKDYKIDAFDTEELYKTYQSLITDNIKWDTEIVDNHYNLCSNTKVGQLNQLIFNIYNLKPSEHIILSTIEDMFFQSMIEDEVLNDPNDPAENYDDIYILENWVLCSWRCISFTASCMSDKQLNEFKYKKYNREYSIILDKQKEELYLLLKNIWLEVVWISWCLSPSLEKDEEPDGETYTNYLVKYSENDKENFIKKSISYLEEHIKKRIKWPTIKKLKNNLLQDISKLDNEYGTEWKNIYLKDIDKDVLLLLHIESRIQILDFSSKKEFYINREKEIFEEIKDDYYNKIPPILEQEICDVNVKFFSNGDMHFWNQEFNMTTLNSNEKNWCILLFTLIKKWSRHQMDDYLKSFMQNKQEYFPAFSRSKHIKMKTFVDFPARWNKFSRENDIWIYIQKSAMYLELTSVYPDNRDFAEDIGY